MAKATKIASKASIVLEDASVASNHNSRPTMLELGKSEGSVQKEIIARLTELKATVTRDQQKGSALLKDYYVGRFMAAFGYAEAVARVRIGMPLFAFKASDDRQTAEETRVYGNARRTMSYYLDCVYGKVPSVPKAPKPGANKTDAKDKPVADHDADDAPVTIASIIVERAPDTEYAMRLLRNGANYLAQTLKANAKNIVGDEGSEWREWINAMPKPKAK